jgi:pimeloyl-ACP methyl ester carboxylesterase
MERRRREIALSIGTISYVEWVPSAETGSPVLLLHGGGADSAMLSWGELAPTLAAAGHRVIAPDHPGFGRSPRADGPLTQERLVDYVAEFVHALGLDDHVVGGLSLGGGLTLGHLLAHPGQARGAILLGTYGVMPRLTDGPLSALTHFLTFVLLRTGLLNAMTRVYSRSAAAMERGLKDIVRTEKARTPALLAAVMDEAQAGTGLAVFGEWQRDQVLWNRLRTVYSNRLPAIAVPVLLVHGGQDRGVPPARAEEAAAAIPHSAFVVVPGAGHWVQRDRPDLVASAVLAHLRRIDHAAPAGSEST